MLKDQWVAFMYHYLFPLSKQIFASTVGHKWKCKYYNKKVDAQLLHHFRIVIQGWMPDLFNGLFTILGL